MNISILPQRQTLLTNMNIGSKKKTGQKGNINGSNGNLKSKSEQAIDSLNKQKEDLEKSKGSAMAHALETNESKAALDDKLAAIDKKISEIDKQINQIRNENKSEALGTKDKNNNSKQSLNNNKNGAQEDGSTVDISPIINLAVKLNNSKVLYKEAASQTNEVNTLKSDIALDEQRGINPIRTRERVSQLEDNIENVYEQYGKSIRAVNNPKNNSKTNDGEEAVNTVNKRVIDKYKRNIKGNIKNTGQVFNESA